MKKILRRTTLALLLMVGSILSATAQEGGIDPPNPPEPTYNDTYQLTLCAAPDGVATVSGGGKYKQGTKVSVKTSATKSEYKFRRWEKNGLSVSTSANFTYTMPAEAVELTAIYEYDYNPTNPSEPTGEYSYHLYLQSNIAGACTFNRTSGAMAVGGKAVTVKATPATGFSFIGWYEGETLVSSSNSFSYSMPQHDTTLTAHLVYDPTNPSIPSGNQDDVDNELKRGDVNSDGLINGMDVVGTVSCIMDGTYAEAADLYPTVAPDGVINGMDLVEQVDLVMSQPSSAIARKKANINNHEKAIVK